MFKVERIDFFSGEATLIGICHTLQEAWDLAVEFSRYDFTYSFRINGRSDIWYYEQGLVM